MRTITIARQDVNIEALDAEIRAAFGDLTAGISTGPFGVQIHLSDDVTPAHIQQARRIATEHDPKHLTSGQQAQLEREQKLEQTRQQNIADLDVSKYSSQSDVIRDLAQKIAWLEQEIRSLGGG